MKTNGATTQEAKADPKLPPEVNGALEPQLPPAGQLTLEDVQVMIASYQQQIMNKAGEVAGLAMELARRDKLIAQLRKQ